MEERHNNMKNKMKKISLMALLLLFCICFTGCNQITEQSKTSFELSKIPEYSGIPYVTIYNNVPDFSHKELLTTSYEEYSDLDAFGRCGVASAIVGQDIMPTKERGKIGMIKPTGWQTVKYDNVDGKYLYNRCHLIAYQLTAENANEKNLITGTRYFNVEGMLPFENMVADYVKESGNHVMYRVTPIFEGDNMLASGVQMEGYSIEDEGESICFNVYVYNVQPGISIDYSNGESALEAGSSIKDEQSVSKKEIRGNSNSMIYHSPGQRDYKEMGKSKHLVIFSSEKAAESAGYRKAKR